jgi:hypothetical protein
MKITTNPAPVAFNPVTIEITCHTLDELRLLWAMTNTSNPTLIQQAGSWSGIKVAVIAHTNAVNGANMQLFKAVDAALIEAGGKD